MYVRIERRNNIFGYSLSLFNIDSHTEETTWGNVVRGVLTLHELCGLLSGQHLLQPVEGNVCIWNEPSLMEISKS